MQIYETYRHGQTSLPVCYKLQVHKLQVANSKFADGLKVGERKLAGVEMEGYGLYKTGYIEKKQCLMVKSVCDFANETKGDDYQSMCAFSSASFVYFFLKHIY